MDSTGPGFGLFHRFAGGRSKMAVSPGTDYWAWDFLFGKIFEKMFPGYRKRTAESRLCAGASHLCGECRNPFWYPVSGIQDSCSSGGVSGDSDVLSDAGSEISER